jgi:hypothetical protein
VALSAYHVPTLEKFYEVEFVTAKLNADGEELWRARYGGWDLDIPYSLLVDREGNVFATGSVRYLGGGPTHFTVKYSAEGRQLWVVSWPVPYRSEDGERAMTALDESGNFFITLPLQIPNPIGAVFTAKLDRDGNTLWTAHENPSEGERFRATALRIDTDQSVLVSLLYSGLKGDFGRITIKYAQNTTTRVPVIRQEPPDRRVGVGGTITFPASVTGVEPLAYQWRFNGANLAGATNVPLVLSNIQTNQSGAYSLLATNAAGCAVSIDANLTVIEIPVVMVEIPVFSLSIRFVTDQLAQIGLSGGEVGRFYWLEHSTDLIDWRTLGGSGADAGGTASLYFLRGPGRQFFRALTWP